MHSSLSSEANRTMGLQAGVDTYVPKFDPLALAETLASLVGLACHYFNVTEQRNA